MNCVLANLAAELVNENCTGVHFQEASFALHDDVLYEDPQKLAASRPFDINSHSGRSPQGCGNML
jgi:hypothetical protein